MTTQLPSAQLARLTGHKGPIHALAYSSGSATYLLSGSADRSIHLYNPAKAAQTQAQAQTANPALVQAYTGAHGHEVLSLAVSSDNARFVSGGGDKVVFLWDVAAARTVRRFGGGAVGGHGGRVESVAFGGDGDCVVASGSFDGSVRLWDCKSQSTRPLMVLGEARDGVSSVVVREAEVWAAGTDGRVRGYDLRMGCLSVDVLGNPVTSLSLTLQADSLLVSTLDSTIRLMDKADGKMLQSYTAPEYTNTTYRIRSALGAKDNLVISGGEDGWIYAWDTLTGEVAGRVQHSEQKASSARSSKQVVSAVVYKPRVDEWASAGGDGTIVIWGKLDD